MDYKEKVIALLNSQELSKEQKEKLESIFPELKESEDERIRKVIADIVKAQPSDSLFNGTKEKCLAWLEKQSKASKVEQAMRDVEKKAKAFTEANKELTSDEILAQMRGEGCGENDSEDERIRKEIIDYIDSEYRHTLGLDRKNRFIAWLEKQGEQKPVFEIKTPEESLGIDSETYNKIVDECIYGWQKPADYEKGHIQQNDFAPKSATEAANEEKVDNQNCIKSYAQEHIGDKVEPKFKVGDKIYLKPEYRMPDDDTPIANTVFEIRAIDGKHYKFDGSYIFIEDQDKYELVEQKSAWTEEDDYNLQCCIAKIQYDIDNGRIGRNRELLTWLKSLKDRVQPKQEWKQENTHDLTDFENVMMHIGDSFFGENAGLDPNDTIAIKEQATILLGLVPKQEWSEEDELIKKELIEFCAKGASGNTIITHTNDLKRWEDWLKSLRPQTTWKPSDEQIIALRWVLNNIPYNKHKEEISGLLDQIKDL